MKANLFISATMAIFLAVGAFNVEAFAQRRDTGNVRRSATSTQTTSRDRSVTRRSSDANRSAARTSQPRITTRSQAQDGTMSVTRRSSDANRSATRTSQSRITTRSQAQDGTMSVTRNRGIVTQRGSGVETRGSRAGSADRYMSRTDARSGDRNVGRTARSAGSSRSTGITTQRRAGASSDISSRRSISRSVRRGPDNGMTAIDGDASSRAGRSSRRNSHADSRRTDEAYGRDYGRTPNRESDRSSGRDRVARGDMEPGVLHNDGRYYAAPPRYMPNPVPRFRPAPYRYYYGHHRPVLPMGYTRYVFRGLDYYYWEGLYYRFIDDMYLVVRPPVGALLDLAIATTANVIRVTINANRRVAVLGNSVYALDRETYYYQDGVFFVVDHGEYIVVDPPLGALVDYLPYDYETTWINGHIYYIVDNVLYQRVRASGRYMYEVVGILDM